MPPEEVGKSALYSFFISTAISLGIEKRERERELVVRLIAGLIQHSVFTWRHLEKGLRQTLTFLEDWEVDSPLAGRQVADIISALIIQGYSRWEDKNVMRRQLQLDQTLKGSKLSPKQFMEIIDQRTQQNLENGEQMDEWIVVNQDEVREMEEEGRKNRAESIEEPQSD